MTELRVRLPFPLRPYQHEAWRSLKRFSVLVWHRRGGKTVFGVKRCATAACFTGKSNARFGYVAPYYRQAKEIAWAYLHQMLRDIPEARFNESELQVELPNGAHVRLYGADNPDSLRGLYFDGIVLDEVADMKPQVWGEIIRPALADREGWALFIGTPKGVNLFSDLYYRSVSLDEAEWYGEVRRATETGALSVDELEKARREMTPSQWAQEMDCDFGAAVDNVLVPLDRALSAAKRDAPRAEVEAWPRILGVDVARYGDDRSVVAKRQGPVAFRMAVHRNLDTMELAALVARTAEEWHPHAIFVDQGGVGAGVVDRLHQLGFRPLGVDFGSKAADVRFQNKRAEMWWLLAEWVKTGCIPDDQELIRELTAPTYTHANARGLLQLESKDDLRERIRVSPDKADALALTFAEPVAAELPAIYAGLGATSHCVTEHNPYAS